jgi:uncharacterized protein (TIGR02391 family)
MARLIDLVPDADTLLRLAPEELAFYVLRAARDSAQQNQNMILQSVVDGLGVPLGGQGKCYEQRHLGDIEIAVTEAWAWLENQLYLVAAPGINGTRGWRVLGRRAKAIKDQEQWKAIRAAAAFPRELLHPTIAERAWISVMRGEFDSAAIFAFRTVEEAVRAAGGYADTDIGVNLMRKAFHPEDGRLTDKSRPTAERQALSDLFAGALGSYKNPHSHRTVTIRDAIEAQDIVMLASHLLRIVDARRPAAGTGSPAHGKPG